MSHRDWSKARGRGKVYESVNGAILTSDRYAWPKRPEQQVDKAELERLTREWLDRHAPQRSVTRRRRRRAPSIDDINLLLSEAIRRPRRSTQ